MDRPRIRLDKIRLDTLLHHLRAWDCLIAEMCRDDIPLAEIDNRREQAVTHWRQIRAIVGTLDDDDYAHVSDLINQTIRARPPHGEGNPA